MNKQIEAIKRWVEVFDGNWHDELVDSEWADRAHQALAEMRQAIAEAEQPRAVSTLAQQEQETRIAKLEAELMRMQGRELKLQFALAEQPRAGGTLAQPHGCTRSHPHENMDAMCELRTEIARLTNENARLKAKPPAQPLTDEQIEIGRRAPWGEALDPFTAGVRFAETHYGTTQPPAQQAPQFTTGHCKEKAKAGGCQLHNIQCGFPACDRKEA